MGVAPRRFPARLDERRAAPTAEVPRRCIIAHYVTMPRDRWKGRAAR